MLSRSAATAWRSRSTNVVWTAPRDRASSPTPPAPAKRSRTRAPGSRGASVSIRAIRTWSAVGRVTAPRGVVSRRPFSSPARILTEQGTGTRAAPRPCPAAISRRDRSFARSEPATHGTLSSAHTCQAELAAPALQESLAQPTVSVILELRIGGDDPLRFDARILEDRGVAQEIGDPELRQARLAGTQKHPGSPLRKGGVGDPEYVLGVRHLLHPAPRALGVPCPREEDAGRPPLAP